MFMQPPNEISPNLELLKKKKTVSTYLYHECNIKIYNKISPNIETYTIHSQLFCRNYILHFSCQEEGLKFHPKNIDWKVNFRCRFTLQHCWNCFRKQLYISRILIFDFLWGCLYLVYALPYKWEINICYIFLSLYSIANRRR